MGLDHAGSTEKGQALAFVGLLLALILVLTAVVTDVGEVVLWRMGVQNAVDAGGEAGASVLADGLNIIAVANDALLALGIAAFFSSGATLEKVHQLQELQDDIARLTPGLSQAFAVKVAMENGASGAVPLNGLTGSKEPSLMVSREYFLPRLFGRRFPLWMKDDFKASRARTFGDRFIRLGGWRNNSPTLFGGKLLGLRLQTGRAYSLAEAAVYGYRVLGRWVLWPLPVPKYKARLVPVSARPKYR